MNRFAFVAAFVLLSNLVSVLPGQERQVAPDPERPWLAEADSLSAAGMPLARVDVARNTTFPLWM